MKNIIKSFVMVGCLALGQAWAGPVGPETFLTDALFAVGGPVNIYFFGSNAAYDSTISLTSQVGSFFPNHSTTPGAAHNLGSFAVDTALYFRLNVLTTGDQYFTGPASSNADGVYHATVQTYLADSLIPVNGFLIGFEDLAGGGDKDYNDHRYVIDNVSTVHMPEPASFLLLGSALVALGLFRRKRIA